jgi:hypothetical protein
VIIWTIVSDTFPVGFKFSMRKFDGCELAMPPRAALKTEVGNRSVLVPLNPIC